MKCELRTAGGISRFIFFRIISTSTRDPADNIAQDGVFVPAHMSGDARAGTQKPTRLEFQRTPRLMAGIVELRTQNLQLHCAQRLTKGHKDRISFCYYLIVYLNRRFLSLSSNTSNIMVDFVFM